MNKLVHQDVTIGIIGNAQMYQLIYAQANAKSHGFLQIVKFNSIIMLNIYSPRVYYLLKYALKNIIYLHLV